MGREGGSCLRQGGKELFEVGREGGRELFEAGREVRRSYFMVN